MARTFNRAYDQADRILNGSGLSSIVYRKEGGRSDDPDLEDASFFKKARQYILDSKLPYDTKMELYNLVAGSPTKYGDTGQPTPHTKLQRGASNFLKDMVVSITAPVGTPVGKGASMIPGLQTTTDLTRRGLQSLLQNKTIREKLAEFADSYRKPGSKDPIPPNVQLFIDQFSPDKVIDGKRYYTPITDENKSKYFDEESQGRIGKDLKTNLKSELGLYNQGFRRSGKLGAADIKGHEEGWALGRVNYGSYDSRGNWQPGIPDWDGNFTIKDVYDWNRTHRMGPGGIAKTFMDLFDDGGALPLQFAEAVGGTVGAQEGEGREIEFKVPGFSDPVKQLEVMNRLDRPLINPKGLAHLPDPDFGPLDRTEREDKIYSKGVGLPGIGWHHEAFDDPDSTDDFNPETAYTGITDFSYGMKHGGQTMSRGLSGINKSININGQPHSLAWINPGEASALKAMGGSGKKVDGIPAYDFEGADWMGGEDMSISYDIDPSGDYDVPTIQSPTPTAIPAAPDSYWGSEPEPDFGQTGPFGLGNKATINDAENLWKTQWIQANPGGKRDPRTQKEISIEEEWQKARNAPGGLEAIARGYQIGNPLGEQMRNSFNLVNQQLQNIFSQRASQQSEYTEEELTREELSEIVESAKVEGLEDFTPYDGSLPGWMPGWMQAIGGFASRTVIGTGTVGGVGVHVHKDGSITAVSPEDSPGYDPSAHHEPGSDVPFRYRSKPVRQASVSETVEEKPTGIAALLARRSTPALGQAALQPQIDTLVSSGIPLEEAFKMLNINV